jgi:Domain of unknown function (DUF1993)
MDERAHNNGTIPSNLRLYIYKWRPSLLPFLFFTLSLSSFTLPTFIPLKFHIPQPVDTITTQRLLKRNPEQAKAAKMPTLYESTISVFIRNLTILSKLLSHGATHSSSSSTLTEESLISARLIADMQTLAFQVQRVSDNAKNFAVLVAKLENVVWENNEKTFEELQERIVKTVKFLEAIKVSFTCFVLFSDSREGGRGWRKIGLMRCRKRILIRMRMNRLCLRLGLGR